VLKSFSVWECLERLIELLHSSICRCGGKGPMGMNQCPPLLSYTKLIVLSKNKKEALYHTAADLY
jgi:hypothetical protein